MSFSLQERLNHSINKLKSLDYIDNENKQLRKENQELKVKVSILILLVLLNLLCS